MTSSRALAPAAPLGAGRATRRGVDGSTSARMRQDGNTFAPVRGCSCPASV